jgi:hypothetical protein
MRKICCPITWHDLTRILKVAFDTREKEGLKGLLTCCKLKDSWSIASGKAPRASALLNAHFKARQERSGIQFVLLCIACFFLCLFAKLMAFVLKVKRWT